MTSHSQPLALMFHGIVGKKTTVPEWREVGAELYDVPREKFVHMMEYLHQSHYHVTTDCSASSSSNRSVILTFDDGEMNNFTEAFPVLRTMGFQAYFFVIAKRVGKEGYMGYDELRKLDEAGMIIGSHGLTHAILTNLTATQIEEELVASKRTLERNLNIPVDCLSIPRGFCNNQVLQIAHRAGYKAVFISDKSDQLEYPCLGRVAVKGHWSQKRFACALEGSASFTEQLSEATRSTLKLILRESGYNALRNFYLKVFK